MTKTKIPQDIQEKANKIIADFNQVQYAKNESIKYFSKYKGEFLYLNRQEGNYESPICRLRFTGDFEKWEFAIYKHTSNKYDSDEWFFPGSKYADGTIKGALKAGQEAYPPSWTPSQTNIKNLFELILKAKFEK